MTDPVDDPKFWKGRLYDRMATGRELHTAVYDIDPGTWNDIQNQCRGVLTNGSPKEPPLVRAGDRILDAGCAYGIVYDWLPTDVRKNYVGVDISPDLIELARLRNPEGTFLVGDLRDLREWRHKAFDVVLCRSVREMILKNLGQEYWNQIERELLRVGKKLILMEYDTILRPEVIEG